MEKNERLRQYLIYKFMTADKITYLHDGKEEEVYIKEEKERLIVQKEETAKELKRQLKFQQLLPSSMGNTAEFLNKLKSERESLEKVRNAKTIKISDNSGLEEIANQIRCLDNQTMTYNLK